MIAKYRSRFERALPAFTALRHLMTFEEATQFRKYAKSLNDCVVVAEESYRTERLMSTIRIDDVVPVLKHFWQVILTVL